MPCSRWSHFMTQVRGDNHDGENGFLMFGGVNLKSYCRSVIWNFTLHRSEIKQVNYKFNKR